MTCEAMTERLTALNGEWARLADQPIPEGWASDARLAGVGMIGGLPDAVRDDPDAVLLALLERQARGDVLAGRAVLQLMLGKLVTMAARDRTAALDDYLAAAWERIATYPCARRTRRVAANLALDTLKTVVAGRRTFDEQPADGIVLPAAAPAPEPGDAEAVRVIDEGLARGLIDTTTARTLRVVYLEGHSSRAAADRLGTSADSIRWRCSKGVRALRAAAGQLTDALAG